jgi:hypothetical protein
MNRILPDFREAFYFSGALAVESCHQLMGGSIWPAVGLSVIAISLYVGGSVIVRRKLTQGGFDVEEN